jgi:succinate dehydrogenase/fumarate reductase flavoprotein subunit
MESWDVVIIGSGPAALRAAIASSDAGTKPIVIDSKSIGSGSGLSPVSGLAASFDEVDSTAHREDTISAGGEETNKSAAARVCGEAMNVLANLENWGLVLQRRDGGLPFAASCQGHSRPRLVGCGDSTSREITRILEEQVIKRGIVRRADLQVLSLVMDSKQVRGITVLDIQSGQTFGIQAKAVILATEGYQGLWSNISEGTGTGVSLAASAGIKLEGMSNISKHHLTVKGTNLHLPVDILSAGGRYRKDSGEDLEIGTEKDDGNCILDLRTLESDAKIWYAQTIRRIEERTGLDINSEVIPVCSSVAFTLGGAPVDENGRVTFKSQKMWYTGLYAAGRSANTGMHGDGYLPGNLQLEDLVTGEAAGNHAGKWVKNTNFAGSQKIEKEISKVSKNIENYFLDEGQTIGEVSIQLSNLVTNIRNNSEIDVKTLKETKISLTDQSRVMNTELLNAIQIKLMAPIIEAISKSG